MHLDILAIGAHPDDVELCCGGTLAKLVRKGRKAGILDLTAGELGTRGTRALRLREAAEAARILGCVRENLRLGDGSIAADGRNVKKLITVIRKYRPRMLLIPHSHDRHPDHVHAHQLCREAWFYAGLRKISSTLDGRRQEPWRPHNYIQYMQWHEFTPSFMVDITPTYGIRLKAIRAYKSQFYDPASKEPMTKLSDATFFDFVETRAKIYGARIGVPYAEPFLTVDAIGIDDPLHLTMRGG